MADLIECVGYKKLAEMRDVENARLLKLIRDYRSVMSCMSNVMAWPTDPQWLERSMAQLGLEKHK